MEQETHGSLIHKITVKLRLGKLIWDYLIVDQLNGKHLLVLTSNCINVIIVPLN